MNSSGLQELFLKNLNDNELIKIPENGGVIGRNGTICKEYFCKNPYISRNHIKIYCNRGKYLIEDLGSINGTKLNGLKLYPNTSVHLHGGDVISLANMNFEVKYK